MLYIVLILVVAALGLVVTALVTANSLWAWISIGLSVLAGALLLADWLRRRSASADAQRDTAESKGSKDSRAEEPSESSEGSESKTEQPVRSTSSGGGTTPGNGTAAANGEPGEEKTDAADLLVVVGLTSEVVVVDEHPRYHLAWCEWLRGGDTIPIAVKEARELGFTPCALCGPDATLAEQHRGKRTSRK